MRVVLAALQQRMARHGTQQESGFCLPIYSPYLQRADGYHGHSRRAVYVCGTQRLPSLPHHDAPKFSFLFSVYVRVIPLAAQEHRVSLSAR